MWKCVCMEFMSFSSDEQFGVIFDHLVPVFRVWVKRVVQLIGKRLCVLPSEVFLDELITETPSVEVVGFDYLHGVDALTRLKAGRLRMFLM